MNNKIYYYTLWTKVIQMMRGHQAIRMRLVLWDLVKIVNTNFCKLWLHSSMFKHLPIEFFSSELIASAAADTKGAMVSEWVRKTGAPTEKQWQNDSKKSWPEDILHS